jgi:glutaredoxin
MKAIVVMVALASAAVSLAAGAQAMYRYVDPDGKVVYTDRPPPPNARKVEQKNLRGNVIDTSESPVATRDAQQRNPVTLFVFDCGDLCDRAKGLLNRRGVPHALLDTTNADNAEKLKKLTSGLEVPVLQVGTRVLKGLDEAQWQAALDQAGYPKTPPLRAALTGKAEQTQPASANRPTSVPGPGSAVANPAGAPAGGSAGATGAGSAAATAAGTATGTAGQPAPSGKP